MNILEIWKEFSAEWKKVRHDFSESSVHDFRVSARRLISALELAFAVTRDQEFASLIRQFKEVLKRFGPLRDTQVHLQLAVFFGHSDIPGQFHTFLKDREKKEVRHIQRHMRERKRKSLHSGIHDANRSFQDILSSMSRPAIRAAIKDHVRQRFDEVTNAYATYRRMLGAEELHRMRVKFKQFRYAIQAAQPVLRILRKKQIEELKELQGIMGQIHDLDTFRSELVAWSGESGVPVAARLQRKHRALVKAFNERYRVIKGFSL